MIGFLTLNGFDGLKENQLLGDVVEVIDSILNFLIQVLVLRDVFFYSNESADINSTNEEGEGGKG